MIIRKYVAKDMDEAIEQIKNDLGNDAVIVAEKKVKVPGLLGKFKKKNIEVTVVADEEKENELSTFEDKLNEIYKDTIINEVALAEEIPADINDEENDEEVGVQKNNIGEILNKLTNDMNEIKEKIDSTAGTKILNEDRDDLREKLQDMGVYCEHFKYFYDRYDGENISECIKSEIKATLVPFKETPKGKIAIVGPTGAGKTTTVAKLAGYFTFMEKKKVALVTMDVYRIGAVEQLGEYAKIMNIPFRVANTTAQMDNIIKELEQQEYDFILIDTIGRSSRNLMQIAELNSYIKTANPDHTILVLSATTKNKDLINTIETYGELDYDNIIVTKLDETLNYGSLYTISKESKKPIIYATNGQYVPEDIVIAELDTLTNLICGRGEV